jgi:hypothetical protein
MRERTAREQWRWNMKNEKNPIVSRHWRARFKKIRRGGGRRGLGRTGPNEILTCSKVQVFSMIDPLDSNSMIVSLSFYQKGTACFIHLL